MSDFDTEVEATQDGAAQIAALQKKIDDLEKDNKRYREERRAAADAAFLDKYGEAIVAKVKDLPDEHRERMAEALLELRPTQEPEQNEPAPAEETPKVEVPAGLAAVSSAPASGGPGAESMSLEDFKKAVETDGLVVAAQKHGHRVQFPNAENPLATGQATRITGTYRPPS